MDVILPCAYALLLLLQIILLIRAVRHSSGWLALFGAELVSLVAAMVLTVVFNNLPGRGMMPGLTWFTETISSMGAAAAYGVMLVISLILRIARRTK